MVNLRVVWELHNAYFIKTKYFYTNISRGIGIAFVEKAEWYFETLIPQKMC
jgi:hypothetical protein